jgi:G-patch domain
MDKFTIASKPVLLSYIHAGVFVPAFDNGENDQMSFAASSNPALRLAYWDQKAYCREFTVSETPPAGTLEAAAEASKDTEQKSKKRKAESAASQSAKKTMPSHLQFWKDRQAELYGSKPAEVKDTDSADPSPVKTRETVFSYADLNRNCCYLCARQFKSAAEVNKHERLSELHRNNLDNEELKAKGLAKLQKAGITPRTISAPERSDGPTNDYRDRARERRQAYGQPKKPKAQSTPSKAPVEPEPEARPSKGAALLGKMGWSKGQGLGAQGTGIAAPISTELYASGVGLGAVGGKIGERAKKLLEIDLKT